RSDAEAEPDGEVEPQRLAGVEPAEQEADLGSVAPAEPLHARALGNPAEPRSKPPLVRGDPAGRHDDPDAETHQDRQEEARPGGDELDLTPGIAGQVADK